MFHQDNERPTRSQFYKYRDDIMEKNTLVAQDDIGDKVITPEEDIPFTLFDPAPILDYQNKLDHVKKTHQETKDTDKAEQLYLDIINEMPYYPDAYVELGNLFVKVKNNYKAIKYYTEAMTLCPYDIDTDVKLALQQDSANKVALNNGSSIPFPDLDIKHLLDDAKKKKEEEKHFRIRYHTKLRRQLTGAGFNNINVLTADKIQGVDMTSPALSLGAVIDSYMASLALEHNSLLMTQYFYKKAILKFKYDLYSIAHLAMSYRISNERMHALNELDKYIKRYNDHYMYYARALVHGELEHHNEEQKDFIQFMCYSSKGEMESIPYTHSEILSIILQKSIDLETFPIFVESVEQARKVCMIQRAFLCSQNLDVVDEDILFVTELIQLSPAHHFYYGYRGFLYYQQRKLDLALLDFSLAILFSPQSALVNYYHCRASIYLARNELVYANIEEVNAGNSIPKQYSEMKTNEIITTLHFQFSRQCLTKGIEHLTAGYLIQAEKIFYLGLLYNPIPLVYYHYGLAQGLQGKYNFALHELQNAKNSLYYDKILQQSIELLIGIFTDELKQEHEISHLHRKKCEKVLLAQAAPPHEEEKIKKPLPQKLQPELKSLPLKKQSATTIHIQSLLNEEKLREIEAGEEYLKQDLIERQKKKEAELLKKEKMKEKKKKQKAQRKERLNHEHKTEFTDSASDTESEISDVPQETVLLANRTPAKHAITLRLSALEIKVFAYFAACKNHPDYKKTAKLLMVGGSIIGKVREYLFKISPPLLNDIDLVTDISRHILLECCPELKPIKEVDGLLQITIDDIRIDIMCKNNLANLSSNAMERDFFALYMDETGFIYDPTGFSIYNIECKRLRSIELTAETFVNDPLRILRAIYLSIKYDLSLADVRKQILQDRKLLVPRLTDNDGQPEKLVSPGRINAILRKNLSQHLALKNYQLMRDLGILGIIFPEICKYLETDQDWICQQLSETDKVVRVNMNVIYANFIVCAIMNEALDCHQPVATHINPAELKQFYEKSADRQRSKSLLFQSQFSQPGILHGYITRSIISWKFFHATNTNEASSSFIPQQAVTTQNNRFGYYN